MTVGSFDTSTQRAPAKGRILDTATVLFYDDGIRTVGVDKLIAESAVTKATFYKHYGSKDRLILEYMSARSATVRENLVKIASGQSAPADALRAIMTNVATEISTPGFRGCPFINAAAEFSDASHPVRAIVADHRDWYTDFLTALLRDSGHPLPGDAADELVLARDGAMSGGYAGDPVAAANALTRAVDRVLAETHH